MNRTVRSRRRAVAVAVLLVVSGVGCSREDQTTPAPLPAPSATPTTSAATSAPRGSAPPIAPPASAPPAPPPPAPTPEGSTTVIDLLPRRLVVAGVFSFATIVVAGLLYVMTTRSMTGSASLVVLAAGGIVGAVVVLRVPAHWLPALALTG